jgi:hypothetical protein
MRFGSGASKLERVAEFARSLGDSTFRTGDSLGLLAFDSRERTDLMLAPMRSRGAGLMISESLLRAPADNPSPPAWPKPACASPAVRRWCSWSDFHAPLLSWVQHSTCCRTPLSCRWWSGTKWKPEPRRRRMLALRDIETGHRRGLWLRPVIRRRWKEAVDQRAAPTCRSCSPTAACAPST